MADKPDFSHLRALEVSSETTKEYKFTDLEGDPSVICSPADDANDQFLDMRLRMSIEQSKEIAAKPRGKVDLDVDDLKESMALDLENDVQLIAHACIRSWGTAPTDKAGKPVEFSPENAAEFLKALPRRMLIPFRNWTYNVYNFAPKKADGEKLGN